MSFTRAVLAVFVVGVLAIVALFAYRLSKETGKSIPAVFAEVPGEAQQVFGQARTRASEAVSTGRETLRQKENAVLEYVRVIRPSESEDEEG